MDDKRSQRTRHDVTRLALRMVRVLGSAFVTGLRVFFAIFGVSRGRGDAAAPPSTALYDRREQHRP
jgi:hypothetical protein